MVKKLHHLLLLALIGLAPAALNAQIYVWDYTSNAGNPGGVNSESDAPGQGSWTDVMDGPVSANAWSSTVAIPFDFYFYGELVTHLKASANGIVTFDTLATYLTDTNFALPSDSIPDQSILCFWDEFTASAPTGSGDDIRYNVFGSAPNRQLWIKWYSFEIGDPTISFVYMAAVLEETSNKIYIVDLYSNTGTVATADMMATVGVFGDAANYTQAGGGQVNLEGNGSGNTDNDYYTFTPLDSIDGSLTGITNPAGAICPGTYDIELELVNTGVTMIDSVTIEYIVNAFPAQDTTFTGLALDTLDTATLNLGQFTFASSTTYDFNIYITSVNGVTDDNQFNDSLIYEDVQTGLTGAYTIDGSSATGGSNYQTFSDAADALNTFGVCGPVYFEVAAGTYNENVYLGQIGGASSTNTITFDGQDATQAEIVYDGSGTEATWQMDGTDFVIIKNLRFENTKNATDAWNIHLSNGADSNMIDSCRFIMPIATTADNQHIVASGSLTAETTTGVNANFLSVTNSYFRGGETGIHIEGDNTNFTYGYNFSYNVFREMADEAIEVDEVQHLILIGNDVDSVTVSGADGLYLLDINDYTIEENRVIVDDYGIYVLDGNDGYTPTQSSTVVNNMVMSTSEDYAIYLNDFESTVVYHNTLVGEPALQINDQTNTDIRNNIFVALNGYAFDSADTLATGDIVDYNIYGGTGTNLIAEGPNTYTDLAAWAAANTSYNANSIGGTPTFAGPTDFHVIDGIANNVGDNSVGVTVDIDGDSRPASTTVDIGADEYTPLANDMSTLLILSPTNQVCGEGEVFVEVVIQNNGFNPQDTIPFGIQVISGSTYSWQDTVYEVVPAFTTDTVILGPINLNGLSNSLISVFSLLSGDENSSNDTISDSLLILPLPSMLTIAPDAMCDLNDTAFLVASGADSGNVVQWFDGSMNPIAVGDTLEATSVGTYYATQSNVLQENVGAPHSNIGGGGNYTALTSDGLIFEVYQTLTIDSVTVYPNSSGDVYVLLKDENATTLQTTSVTVAALDSVRIPVGFTVQPGTYQLTSSTSTSTGGLYRNSSGGVYPYSGASMAITGPVNALAGYYYFFYDWKVTSAGCESVAASYDVFIDSTDVMLPDDETICQEDEEFIEPEDLGFEYVSYVWQDGSTDTAYTATTAGTVAVTVTSIWGCERSDVMVVDTFPVPQVFIGEDTAFCEGEGFEVTWTATSGFNQYFWSNAGQTQSITVDYAGSFSVTVTDNNGCEGSDTAVIALLPLPIADAGEDTTICPDSSFVLPVAGGTLTSVWTDDNANVVTEATDAGTYYLEVTDENGCSNFDTLVVMLLPEEECVTGIQTLGSQSFSFYPNPARTAVTIEMSHSLNEVNLTLRDALGKVILSESAMNGTRHTLDVSNLAKGYYLLELSDGNEQSINRLIIQ